MYQPENLIQLADEVGVLKLLLYYISANKAML